MRFDEARQIAREMLSDKRFHHSECVAKCAIELAPGFGADKDEAGLAGMLHDVMKEQSNETLLELILSSDIAPVPDYMNLKPLWHAWAGAEYVTKKLGLSEEIGEAVRNHTSGRAGMSPLERTIFLADYISEDRTFDGCSEVREVAKKDVNLACLAALQNMICHLVSSGRCTDINSLLAYNSFLNELSSGKEMTEV